MDDIQLKTTLQAVGKNCFMNCYERAEAKSGEISIQDIVECNPSAHYSPNTVSTKRSGVKRIFKSRRHQEALQICNLSRAGTKARWRESLAHHNNALQDGTDIRQATGTVKSEEVVHLSMPYIIAPHHSLLTTTLVRGDNKVPEGTTGQPHNNSSNGSIPGLYRTVTTAAEMAADNSIPENISGQYDEATSAISASSGISNGTPYPRAGSILVGAMGGSNSMPGSIAGENHQNTEAVMMRGNSVLDGTPRQLQTAAVVIGSDSTSEGIFDGIPTTTMVRGESVPGQPHQRTVAQQQTFDSTAAAVSDNTSSENTPGPSSVDNTIPAGETKFKISILENVRVAGVEVVESYSECITCTNRVVPDINDPELGTCLQCSMMQCMDDTNVVLGASLVLRVGEREFLPLRAFGNVVEFIAQKSAAEVSMKALLKAEPFTISHRGGVILSATRCIESTTKTIGHTISLHTS